MALPFYVSPEQFMKDKADYARKGVGKAKPALVLEYADGVAFVAENPSATLHKVSELYDRVAFAGVGLSHEFEALRMHGIRQADVLGYTYSRHDVTARALANAYSQILGQIFTAELKPYEVEIVVAQVGDGSQPNEIYHIMYDGTLADEQTVVAVGGPSDDLKRYLEQNYSAGASLADVVTLGARALNEVGGRQIPYGELEVAALDRTRGRRKFRRLTDSQVEAILK